MLAGPWSKGSIVIGNLLVRSVVTVQWYHPLKVDCIPATHNKEYSKFCVTTISVFVHTMHMK